MKHFSFHQQGQRPYQEDHFYADPKLGLWIVCDGVGGANRGEVASQLAIQTIVQAVKEDGILPTRKEAIQQLILKIEEAFAQALQKDPAHQGMATTLTLLYLHENGATTAHIGDSRIYWLQPRHKRYWHTRDHSLVQDLYDAGLIKSEEAMKEHPRRNVITKALSAKNTPAGQHPSTKSLQGLEAGDILLLCSDGVLEPFSERGLAEILADPNASLQEKTETIRQACEQDSRDNNTAILIELETGDLPLTNSGKAPSDFPWRRLHAGPTMLSDTP